MTDAVGCFSFVGTEVDRAAGTVALRYATDAGHAFTETIGYGRPLPPLDPAGEAAFRAAIDALHVLAGTSYYKAHIAPLLDLNGLPFAPEQVAFFRDAYAQGLAEFAYRNAIDLVPRLNFTGAGAPRTAGRLRGGGGAAVLVGGGKDSLVSVEVLRDQPGVTLLSVNPRAPMLESAAPSGLPLVSVTRTLDPLLLEWARTGTGYNGHVPVTAIVSLIAVVGAFFHGYRDIVLSNERSADEPTVPGSSVNHQFSKSSAFEDALGDYLMRCVAPELRYFSLLRPLSELHIGALFARTDRYDRVFTSCNRAFRLSDRSPVRWCGDCAKCRFTFLVLATAMPRDRLLGIFGRDLLADPAQLAGYRELAGLTANKPWDCVGEVLEAQAALVRLAGESDWRDRAVVAALAPGLTVAQPDPSAAWPGFFAPWPSDRIPPRYAALLDSYLG